MENSSVIKCLDLIHSTLIELRDAMPKEYKTGCFYSLMDEIWDLICDMKEEEGD